MNTSANTETQYYNRPSAEVRKQATPLVTQTFNIPVQHYYDTEFETGMHLLLNTLGWMTNKERFKQITDRLLGNPVLGYWNWFINYRQQQEQLFLKEIMNARFTRYAKKRPAEAKLYFRRRWNELHEDLTTSELAFIACGEFIKDKITTL